MSLHKDVFLTKVSDWQAKLCYMQHHQPSSTVNLDAHWTKVTGPVLGILGRLLFILVAHSDGTQPARPNILYFIQPLLVACQGLKMDYTHHTQWHSESEVINYCNFTDRHAFTQSLIVNYGLMKYKLKDMCLTGYNTTLVPYQ